MATVELSALTLTLLAAKRQKGLSFADLEALLGRDDVWVASLFYGQSAAAEDEATKLVEALGLEAALIPHRQCPNCQELHLRLVDL
jgi:cyanate lyase